MQRRHLLAAPLLLALRPALAHHGWSSFDQARPIWLEGQAVSVAWRNPHAELVLELPADLKLPVDLASRPVPTQTAPVDVAHQCIALMQPGRALQAQPA